MLRLQGHEHSHGAVRGRSYLYIINVLVKEIVFTQKKKPSAPYDGVTVFFIMLLWSRNHGESSKQSLEPVGSEIFLARRAWDYQKDFNGFLPVRAQKRFVLFDWFVFVHFCPELPEFSDYGEIRIQEIMCFITWITINAHALGTCDALLAKNSSLIFFYNILW